MEYSLRIGNFNAPAEPHLVEKLPAKLGITLPTEYLDFLRQHNGGEGFIGDNYIALWKAEEIVDFNREYEVEKYAPGILLFGSNGGGEAYGFDTALAGMPIVRVPFIGMDRRYAMPIADKFPEIFTSLAVKS